MRLIIIRFLLITLSAIWVSNAKANYSNCSVQDISQGWCEPHMTYGSNVESSKRKLLLGLTHELINGILKKNARQFINYEIGNARKEDQLALDPYVYDWLFSETKSKYFNGVSVRTFLINSKQPAIDIEAEKQWGDYKGELYILIFYDMSKIDIKKIGQDINSGHRYWMKSYAACLIQKTPQGWVMPFSICFAETDGP